MPPDEDRAMAKGYMHRKFGEVWRCGSQDMCVGRQKCSSQYSTAQTGIE